MWSEITAEDYDALVIAGGRAPTWPAHPEWLAKFFQLLGTKIDS